MTGDEQGLMPVANQVLRVAAPGPEAEVPSDIHTREECEVENVPPVSDDRHHSHYHIRAHPRPST